jgi:hypothetical protein
MKRSIYCTLAVCAVAAAGALNGFAQEPDAGTTATTVTNVSGTIAQLNYDNTGSVQGFLVGTNTLLTFPTDICGGIGSLGAVGNSITYSGSEVAASSGFETVVVSSFTNNTTKASYTAPSSSTSSTPTTYGPTSGTLKQLNYAAGGTIDGFVFAPSGGGSIFVSIGGRVGASSTLTSLLTAGATVSVTGTTSPAMAACTSTGTLESVDASSLTVGSQTIVIVGGGFGGRGNGPGPGHGPGH